MAVGSVSAYSLSVKRTFAGWTGRQLLSLSVSDWQDAGFENVISTSFMAHPLPTLPGKISPSLRLHSALSCMP
jgi:hypothetical protein